VGASSRIGAVNFWTQTGYKTTEMQIEMSQYYTLCLHHFRYAISEKITVLSVLWKEGGVHVL